MRLPLRWSTLRKRASASQARSWQNLWKALEFLVSMELRRQMARLKTASCSSGSLASTLRQVLMACSISPSFLKQMPMLMSELRQRVLLGVCACSELSMMKLYSLMASSFCPLMRQRLARLQWLIASFLLMASEVRQHRLASTYLPSARQQQPMLQQAWKQLGLNATARMQLSMALSKQLLACSSLPRLKQSSAFCWLPWRLLLAEASLILRDCGRWCSSAFMQVIQQSEGEWLALLLLSMNIIGGKGKGAVSLKELIPEHQSLKLLILHTPFAIDISTLAQCLNLVKLDLSNNNLASFPYLGHLRSLKIIFIHDNHLAIEHFTYIFTRSGEQSALALNVVWITFWGNKHPFLARHFAANNTNAIAFDRNLIAEEEKTGQLMPHSTSYATNTDISHLLLKRSSANNYSTEEEYMQDFWLSLRMLRKKHEAINPVIKIQKCYRGWIFRQRLRREFTRAKQNYLLLHSCFKHWKSSSRNQRKLATILAEKGKTLLLFPNCRINRSQIEQRLRELAKIARNAVLQRRLLLQHQIRFYSILRGNYDTMQDLYSRLQLKQSAAVYIHKDRINEFVDYVVPFVQLSCSERMEHSFNEFYHLHYLHEPMPKQRLQFIKMIKTNKYSVVSYEKPMERMLKMIRFKKPTALQTKMKAVFGKFHASKEQREKMVEHQRKIEQGKKEERDQLIKIPGSYELLKTIVRGVFFYNSKRLSLPKSQQDKRINLLSEMCIRKISSAVSIQRAWKGYSFRKKHQSELQIILKYQKAVTMIQRWFRRLPSLRKRYFLFSIRLLLNCVQESSFCVDFDQYREMVKPQAKKRSILLQQHAMVYKNTATRKLVLSWDNESGRYEVDEMIRIKKPLFSQAFLHLELGMSKKELAQNRTQHVSGLERCDAAFLFHYQTETSLIKRNERKYLEIRYRSKSQAKLRVLAIALLSFNFKLKRSIRIHPLSHFSSNQLSCRNELAKRQLVIVCNQNIGFIKTIEEQFVGQSNISIYMINNKIFLQFSLNKKPFKIEERFFVYLINFQQEQQKPPIVSTVKEQTIGRVLMQGSLADLTQKEDYHGLRLSTDAENSAMPKQRKVLARKRSIKQFNAKINRKKNNHPSFIIDNKSDRITHQSNLQPTQRHQRQKIVDLPKSSFFPRPQKLKAAHLLQQKRKMLDYKQQQLDFTKKFVNLGNFMQSQFISDHHRRIKTEIEQSAYNSAEEVRLTANRSATMKEEKLSQKHRKAREMESLHRSLLQQNRAHSEEQSLLQKKNLAVTKESRREERSFKKPKVSFAEESFPLIVSRPRIE